MVSSTGVILAIVFHLIGFCLSQTCDEPYQCVGQSLSPVEKLEINGYKGAFGPTTSFSGDSVSCLGASSCRSMSSITTSSGEIACKGTHSCYNTSMDVSNDWHSIKCFGFQSCAFSNLTLISANTFRCYGEQSCANSRIHTDNDIEATGAYSLYLTTIYSQNSLTIELTGELAGYGAKLVCGTGHTCDIYCNGRNSCYMFFCIGTCNIHAASGNIEPTKNLTQFSEINDIYRTATLTEELCNAHPNARTYDPFEAQKDAVISIPPDTSGPICCRGRTSCGYTNIAFNMPTTTAAEYVLCGGLFACIRATINANNASVFCDASDACFPADLHNTSHLYCRGYLSCKTSTITSSRYITCSSRESCTEAIIYSAGTDLDLDLTGYWSGKQTKIYCNEADWCNIRCIGYKSCLDAELYCSGTCNVYCDASSGCPMGWTSSPTFVPTIDPTASPTFVPTIDPTSSPIVTLDPTSSPTHVTVDPTSSPTQVTIDPTSSPTRVTIDPTSSPTQMTIDPTEAPTIDPTGTPTSDPTEKPSVDPTETPTLHPSGPSAGPSLRPSSIPSSPPYEAEVTDAITTSNDDENEMIGSNHTDPSVVIGIVIGMILLLTMVLFVEWYRCRHAKMKHEQIQENIESSERIENEGGKNGRVEGESDVNPKGNLNEMDTEQNWNEPKETQGNEILGRYKSQVAVDAFIVHGDEEGATKGE